MSVFVTVGTELPFDRLISAVDDWAGRARPDATVVAQIGTTELRPRHLTWTPMLGSAEFRRLFFGADLVIAHAGMGTILSALEHSRPLIVVPRQAGLGEHRNDHQLATARHLSERGLVDVAWDVPELVDRLEQGATTRPTPPLGPLASDRLIETIRAEVWASRGRERVGCS